MTHDPGMPHARRTVPHHVGWKGSSVCSEPPRAYGTQTRSLDCLQQRAGIYMHTNSSLCRMRLFPYAKLAPFWTQKFPLCFQTLPQGGLTTPPRLSRPPERHGGYGPCCGQRSHRAVCLSCSSQPPGTPAQTTCYLKNLIWPWKKYMHMAQWRKSQEFYSQALASGGSAGTQGTYRRAWGVF